MRGACINRQLQLPLCDIASLDQAKIRDRVNDLALLTMTNANDWNVCAGVDELVFTHDRSGHTFRFPVSAFLREQAPLDSRPDVRVQNEGSLCLFHPLTAAAEEWFGENLEAATRFGNAVVVEHRLRTRAVSIHARRWSGDRAMMEYKPTNDDIEWATSIIQLVNEGGILALPRLLYRMEHSRRRLVLLNTPVLNTSIAVYVHHRATQAISREVGYHVTENQDS